MKQKLYLKLNGNSFYILFPVKVIVSSSKPFISVSTFV